MGVVVGGGVFDVPMIAEVLLCSFDITVFKEAA